MDVHEVNSNVLNTILCHQVIKFQQKGHLSSVHNFPIKRSFSDFDNAFSLDFFTFCILFKLILYLGEYDLS